MVGYTIYIELPSLLRGILSEAWSRVSKKDFDVGYASLLALAQSDRKTRECILVFSFLILKDLMKS